MNGSGRKRYSKWDLKEELDFASDSKQLRSALLSGDVGGSNSMGFSPKEPCSGGRGSNKDDVMDKDFRVQDATMAWDADGIYSKKLSPGFEEWKYRRHSQSPKNGWSRPVRRSRSRSPARGFRRDSGANGRNRMKAGGLTQPCRDFTAGKCRRGRHCHFLHHDNQNYEDNWESKHREDGATRYSAPHESRDYSLRSGRPNEFCINFAKGRCRMGASCKYVHHDNSDGLGKGSVDESTTERETDRRRRDNSFEQGGRHGLNRSGDTPCKFFATGNCRNGKYCRFSHDQACRSPNRRSRDERWASNSAGDNHALDRPKLSHSESPDSRLRNDRWGSDGNLADMNKVWDSPTPNDAVAISDAAKLVEDKSVNILSAPEAGITAWPTSLDKSREHGEPPFLSDKKEVDHWAAENAGPDVHVSQAVSTDIWPGHAEMSPDWNYKMGSSCRVEEEHGPKKHGLTQGGTYLASSEHDGIPVAPGQALHQNVQNVNALLPSSCHSVEQSKLVVPILPSRVGIVEGMHNQEVSTEKKYLFETNIMDSGSSQVGIRNPPTQNMVSKEQLAQLTNLTASLAHILGTGQQLPQLYAALSSHDSKDSPSLAKSEVPGKPVSNPFAKPDPAVGLPKQYDPMCDSIEPKNDNASGVPPGFSPNKNIAEHAEIPLLMSNSGWQNFDNSCKNVCSAEQIVKSESLIQLQPGQNVEVNEENNEVVDEELKISQDDHKNTKENGPLGHMDQNSGPDEAKKIKDGKGIRAFKFALVEFVKELLKPTWKDGQITKEDYKIIVKKVVDKVTGAMQGAHIPQTQEKIDHYLSFSKPKLTKLVQAYVEKVQKA